MVLTRNLPIKPIAATAMPLYLVATPIGNLEDITLRALRILKEVSLIACEDTRHTRKLLEHFGIHTPTISYHEHNEQTRAQELTARLLTGESLALVTDAGTPGISDPAYRVVVAAIAAGIQVIPLPGATALIAGLIASGLPTDTFLFVGFLPTKRKARREKLEALRAVQETLVFYEAPHRIRETLLEAEAVLGNRQAVLARELTKLYEQFLRGKLADLSAQLHSQEPRGEMTLVIAGASEERPPLTAATKSLTAQLAQLMQTGSSRNEALKQLAKMRGLSKKEAYRLLLEEKGHAENT